MLYPVADMSSQTRPVLVSDHIHFSFRPRYLEGIYYDMGVIIMSICFACLLMSPETCAYEWKKSNTDKYVHCLLDSQQEEKRRFRC